MKSINIGENYGQIKSSQKDILMKRSLRVPTPHTQKTQITEITNQLQNPSGENPLKKLNKAHINEDARTNVTQSPINNQTTNCTLPVYYLQFYSHPQNTEYSGGYTSALQQNWGIKHFQEKKLILCNFQPQKLRLNISRRIKSYKLQHNTGTFFSCTAGTMLNNLLIEQKSVITTLENLNKMHKPLWKTTEELNMW